MAWGLQKHFDWLFEMFQLSMKISIYSILDIRLCEGIKRLVFTSDIKTSKLKSVGLHNTKTSHYVSFQKIKVPHCMSK